MPTTPHTLALPQKGGGEIVAEDLPHKGGGEIEEEDLPHKEGGEIVTDQPVAPSPSMREGWAGGGSIFGDGDY